MTDAKRELLVGRLTSLVDYHRALAEKPAGGDHTPLNHTLWSDALAEILDLLDPPGVVLP